MTIPPYSCKLGKEKIGEKPANAEKGDRGGHTKIIGREGVRIYGIKNRTPRTKVPKKKRRGRSFKLESRRQIADERSGF